MRLDNKAVSQNVGSLVSSHEPCAQPDTAMFETTEAGAEKPKQEKTNQRLEAHPYPEIPIPLN